MYPGLSLTTVLLIPLSIAIQEQWPDQAVYFWVLTGILIATRLAVSPTSLSYIGRKIAPYVVPYLPKPELPPARRSAYEDPAETERRYVFDKLRAIVRSGQLLRSKMSHAAHWLNDEHGSDKFGYYDWRSEVRAQMIELLPEDADHFSKPPVGPEVEFEYSDEYAYAPTEVTAGSPNRDLLGYLDVDLEVLTRLLKNHALTT